MKSGKTWVCSYSVWIGSELVENGITEKSEALALAKELKCYLKPEMIRITFTQVNVMDHEAPFFSTEGGKNLKKREIHSQKWQRKPSIVNEKGNVNVSALIYRNEVIDFIENRDKLNNTGSPRSRILDQMSGKVTRKKGKLKYLSLKDIFTLPMDKVLGLPLYQQRYIVANALNKGNTDFVYGLLRNYKKPVKVSLNRKFMRKFFPEVPADMVKDILK